MGPPETVGRPDQRQSLVGHPLHQLQRVDGLPDQAVELRLGLRLVTVGAGRTP